MISNLENKMLFHSLGMYQIIIDSSSSYIQEKQHCLDSRSVYLCRTFKAFLVTIM